MKFKSFHHDLCLSFAKGMWVIMAKIDKSMIIGDILKVDQGLIPILLQSGMHCLGCPSSQMESLEDACMVHGIDVDEVVEDLNNYLEAAAI